MNEFDDSLAIFLPNLKSKHILICSRSHKQLHLPRDTFMMICITQGPIQMIIKVNTAMSIRQMDNVIKTNNGKQSRTKSSLSGDACWRHGGIIDFFMVRNKNNVVQP